MPAVEAVCERAEDFCTYDPWMQTESTRADRRRLMPTRATAESIVISVVCALYVAFLLKLLLLSRPVGSERSINLVPFASIAQYLTGGSPGMAFGNLAGNVLIFVPVGVYLAFFRGRATVVNNALVVVGLSILVEVVQGVFAIGSSDIDDVILNSLGGVVGILAARLLALGLRTRARARTALAVLSLVLAPVLVYLLFVIRLRM